MIAALQDGAPFGGGHGFGGHGFGSHFVFGPWGDLSAAAGALGITEDEVRSALRDGQTLADLAEANGVDNPLHLRRGRNFSVPKLET